MSAAPVRFSVTIEDSLGLKAAAPIYLEVTDTQTVAQLVTALGTWAGYMNAVTDGLITRAVATVIAPSLPSGSGKPISTGRVSNVAVLDMGNAVNTRIWGAVVPSIAGGAVVGGKLNLSNTDVANLFGYLAGSSAPLLITNPEGQALNVFLDAFLAVRKHRRLEHERTLEIS